MTAAFQDITNFLPKEKRYALLPFRFIRLDAERYVAVNEVGEWQMLKRPELNALIRKTLSSGTSLYYSLKSKHFIEDADSDIARDLLTLKIRTKRQRVSWISESRFYRRKPVIVKLR
jgi:uncharacterized protein